MKLNKILVTVLFSSFSASCLAVDAVPQEKPPAPETVLASTDNDVVTYADFLAELNRVPEKNRFEFLLARERVANFIDGIMLNKALSREARAIGLDKQDDFKLEMQNQAEKSLARRRREHIMASLPAADLTAVARESYLINGARYAVPTVYETWHVLINTKKRSKQDAQKLAEELRTKLVAGANTEEIATSFSDDTSAAKNKGVLPQLAKEDFVPEYGAAIAKMKIGEISQVVETQFGFHVIKLLATTPARKVPFDEVKEVLIQEAQRKREDTVFKAHIDKIQRNKSFKLNTEAIDKLRPKVPVLPGSSPPLDPPKS